MQENEFLVESNYRSISCFYHALNCGYDFLQKSKQTSLVESAITYLALLQTQSGHIASLLSILSQ